MNEEQLRELGRVTMAELKNAVNLAMGTAVRGHDKSLQAATNAANTAGAGVIVDLLKVVEKEVTNEITGALRAAVFVAHDAGLIPDVDASDMSTNELSALLLEQLSAARSEVAELRRQVEEANAARALAETPAKRSYQDRVFDWLLTCFGEAIASDTTERADRFCEEALELLQSINYPEARIRALIDYVYDRPHGAPEQEVGGVMVTLAGLCWAAGIDLESRREAELARVWAKIDHIREKQKAKPVGSALPTGIVIHRDAPMGDVMRYGDMLRPISVIEAAAPGTYVLSPEDIAAGAPIEGPCIDCPFKVGGINTTPENATELVKLATSTDPHPCHRTILEPLLLPCRGARQFRENLAGTANHDGVFKTIEEFTAAKTLGVDAFDVSVSSVTCELAIRPPEAETTEVVKVVDLMDALRKALPK